MSKIVKLVSVLALPAVIAGISGCGSNTAPAKPAAAMQQTQKSAVSTGTEKPLPPEKNPTGDIPDSQVFVKYTPTAGTYELQVPEGWSQVAKGDNVTFTDKFNGVQLTVTSTSTPPSVQNVSANQAIQLQKNGRAVTIKNIKQVQLAGGPAVLINYDSNSEPDPVVGKQVRLEDNSYLFYKNGKLATLTMWAPLGADNVDQWKRMSDSFKWR